jgi:ribosomal protein S18 acetylase RimI-like enzyme
MFILRVPIMNQVLERFGVLCRWRAGMTLDLRRLSERPALPAGYEIVEWDAARLGEVAHVDWLSYRNSLDAKLYWQYFSTPAGCELMWREAIAGKFGRFDPQRTLLLMKDGRVCGDVMASARTPREGFIGNLAVEPRHRGGTGVALLMECLWRYKDAGFERVSLAVTLDNVRAYRLYSKLGFVISGRFPLIARPSSHLQKQTG